MSSILEQLYKGELCPAEKAKPNNARLGDICNKIESEMEYFRQKLCKEDADRLDKMDELYLQVTGIETCDNFVYGFKLGAAFMAEVFSHT